MKKLALLFYVLLSLNAISQDLFTLDEVKHYHLYFYDANWDAILDSFETNYIEDKILATLIVDGVVYDSVGVKYKGNSSYNPNQVKNPMHIELDYVKDQNIQGYENLKLSNGFKDPSMVREVMSFEMLRNYMPAPRANYAMVYVNGAIHGLFAVTQSVNKDFVDEHFGSKTNSFFKCDPVTITGTPSPPPQGCPPVMGTASPLIYQGPDTACYKQSYEIQSDDENHWVKLVNMISTMETDPGNVYNVLNIDRALWMLVFNNLFVNMDSYTGSGHNYYIYENDYERFQTIIWDLNENIGVFINLGGQPPTILSINDMINFDPLYGMSNPDRPLLAKLLNNPDYKRMYMAHYRTMLNENVNSNYIRNRSLELQALIDSYVQNDPNKLYSYADFLNNLDNNIPAGMTIPGINLLMDARATFLNSHTEITFTAPDISNVQQSLLSPTKDDTVWISATVTNGGNVRLNYKTELHAPFTKQPMYDDGMHHDGNPGDQVFGAAIPPQIQNSNVWYFIYANNNEAGKYSPERAEYVCYTYSIEGLSLQPGDLVINELMASNGSYMPDNYGEYDDWVELYNNSDYPLNLYGISLSDEITDRFKWTFPDTVIEAHDYLVIWTDSDPSQTGLHAGFKLSASGEALYLSNADSAIIDSITFTAQTTNITFGRYPNGTGPWQFLTPTIGDENQPLSVQRVLLPADVNIYPNPADDKLYAECSSKVKNMDIEIFNLLMQKLMVIPVEENRVQVDVSNLCPGVYILRISNYSARFIVR